MIKAVLFDLDGTLLDRDRSLRSFISGQYDRMHTLHVIEKRQFVDRFIELDRRGYVGKDQVYASLLDEFSVSGISADELLADYMQHFRNHCVPCGYLHETLQYVASSGIRMGIVTNGIGEFQWNTIKALDIEPYFEVILVSELEGVKKPDAEIFRRALRKLGMEASEAVYVGDHPENDVQASKRAGMTGIWKYDAFYDDDFDRDGTIHELIELKDMLGKGSAGKPAPATAMVITYLDSTDVKAEDVSNVFMRSGIKRPYQDVARIGRMIAHADILITAWAADRMIGVARALTDYSYCCYLSDLAIDREYQYKGVGKRLVDMVREKIGKECSLVLISAPGAVDYYPKLGFQQTDKAFVIARER